MTHSALKTTSKKAVSSFNKDDWASAYCNVEEELTNFSLTTKEGEIPKQLCGTFYRNGPGRLERGGQWVHHPFDGDGMIAAIRFKNGEVTLSNRFIRTEGWEADEKAGKFVYRGVFGTQKPGGLLANAFDLRLKNIANTNVIKFGGNLLALWEAAGPHEINPITLETNGLTTLNGVLKENEPLSAHPRFDPGHHGKPTMVIFGVKTGPKSTIRTMEFTSTGESPGELINEREDVFKGFAFLHDFAITPNWAIYLQNAISFNPLPFLIGQKGAAQCLASEKNKKGKIWLIPRESGEFAGQSPKIIEGPEGFIFHHLNASENEMNIFLDSIYYKDFPSIGPNTNFREIDFEKIPEGILKRCKINLSDETIKLEVLSDQCCEFAMVNPANQGISATYSWMAIAESPNGNGPLQGIKKLNLNNGETHIWSTAPRGFVSEPLFIANPYENKEDSGWVISLVWNAEEKVTELVILNANDMTIKCKLDLPIAIPHGLHGSWVEEQL